MILNDLRINRRVVFAILVFVFLISQAFVVDAVTSVSETWRGGFTGIRSSRSHYCGGEFSMSFTATFTLSPGLVAALRGDKVQASGTGTLRGTESVLKPSELVPGGDNPYCELFGGSGSDIPIEVHTSGTKDGDEISLDFSTPQSVIEYPGYSLYHPGPEFTNDPFHSGAQYGWPLKITSISDTTVSGTWTDNIDAKGTFTLTKQSASITPPPTTKSAPAEKISQPVISEVASDTQEQGNRAEWEDKLREETGPGSDIVRTLDECEKQKQEITNECQSSAGGWRVVVMIGINDIKSGKNYDFQEAMEGGCKKSRRFREPFKVNISSPTFHAAEAQQKGRISRDYQLDCSFMCSSWNCEDTYIAIIASYDEAANVIRNEKTLPIRDVSFIQEGDVIVTGDGGTVVFKLVGEYNEQTGQFNDNDMVEVMPNSRLNIRDPELGAEIIYGNAKVHIEKGSNRNYVIRTPTARVVAKGTDYIVAADPADGKTNVYLSDGTLQIVQLSTNEAILINSGEKLTVSNQDLGTPVQMAAGEWDALIKKMAPTAPTFAFKNLTAILTIAVLIWAVIESVRYVRKKKSSSKK